MKRLLDIIMFILISLICAAQKVVIDYPQYRSVFDTTLQIPVQVEWSIKKEDISKTRRNPSWRFKRDIIVPGIKATHDDYTNSGYERGHMCPAADRSNDTESMKSTFMISNISPQAAAVNRGAWKATETYIRQKIPRYDTIDVLVIPVLINRDTTYIGKHSVAVPHAFFKSAWVHGTDSVIGAWFIFNR